MFEKITKLIENELIRKQMSENSLKIFEEKFTLEIMIDKYKKLYGGYF